MSTATVGTLPSIGAHVTFGTREGFVIGYAVCDWDPGNRDPQVFQDSMQTLAVVALTPGVWTEDREEYMSTMTVDPGNLTTVEDRGWGE